MTVTLFDPPAARAARERGIRQADAHADIEWKITAYRSILYIARTHPFFTADEVWEDLESTDEWTHEPAALGPLMLKACREGYIVKTDRLERTKIPRRHRDLVVWQSLTYGQAPRLRLVRAKKKIVLVRVGENGHEKEGAIRRQAGQAVRQQGRGR